MVYFLQQLITYNSKHNLEENYFFIDRSPKHFDYILNHLRSCSFYVPSSTQDINELILECDFYGLDTYKSYLNTILTQRCFPKHTVSQPFDIRHTSTINSFLKHIETNSMTIVDKTIFRDGSAPKVVFFIQRKTPFHSYCE